MQTIQGLMSAFGAPSTAPPVHRCEGGCLSIVAARGDCCAACEARQHVEHRSRLLADAEATLPRWPWATFAEKRLRDTAERDIWNGAYAWKRAEGSMVLLGRTGAGKTACVVALARRIIETARGRRLPLVDMQFAIGLRFISAKDLAQARREHKLGAGESPLEAMANRATLLILDELGYEPQIDSTISDVVDARYRAGLPIIVTSGLTEVELAGRYGDAVKRRLCERGRVVSGFDAARGT